MFILRQAPRLRPYIYTAGILFLAVWIVLSSVNRKPLIEQIQDRGYLRVVSLAAPLATLDIDGNRTGFEYQLATNFADYLGVGIEFIIAKDHQHAFQALRDRRVDIAAANLHLAPSRESMYYAHPSYRGSRSLVIYRETQGFKPPKSLSDIKEGEILVLDGSAEALQLLSINPSVEVELLEELNHLDLMTLLQNREASFAIVPSDLFSRVKSYHPELAIAFELETDTPAVWYSLKSEDQTLNLAVKDWQDRPATDALIGQLNRDSYPPKNPLNFVETHAFRLALEERYEPLNPFFIKAGALVEIDHHILAAVGYQESHWDEDAVSNTGVRGIMMLTQATAEEVGVDDRTDPQESILGGAKYLRKMEEKIPDRIPEPERLWLAMAGYNVGFGHLEDARILTQRGGKNADKWEDVAQFLPLLEDPEIAANTRHGEARGSEPVTYVNNIQKYTQIIEPFRRLNQNRTIKLEPLD
ncbi:MULTISPECIES: membrane-bound lytic murein transglycosylase MltF [unclassified Marinobacterium]|uniref:membrane-bound lytic murein transglycosylase MltF n=1 Tax=unclassified Marinobacterium TaxID=2644139 RepID=UPI0015689820|nr:MULTISPECIES: membrane-bound lytic murein transglycosylase MltF [unclassified Marinobacterium]NRP57329.1 Membrane-bound lytic murein transglycosylase F precursor [Marinobacterium sp. xm-d-510]NRP97841.1 Membrane-bound lytic murein transglycosylase F precursor [Marinobacterium sp. xm-a-127]